MKPSFAALWRPSGSADRRTYVFVGLAAFAVKHNLDRLVATAGFHRPWGLFNYWIPIRNVARITALSSKDAVFLATMVAPALPFIWLGVAMTLKRLRSAQLPPALILLFFVPYLNLLFLLALCLWPEREVRAVTQASPRKSWFSESVPRSALGSAAFAVILSVPAGYMMAVFATYVLANYGWGLFVAVPFSMGFAAAIIYGLSERRSLAGCMGVACLSVCLLGVSLLALAVEGVFCLMMAMPLALPLAAFGGAFGYLVQDWRWLQRETPAFLGVLLCFVPGVQWLEHTAAPPAPVLVVRSSIDIASPPEEVWKQVVAFTEIPAPSEWMFRAGIAYPIRAEMQGTGTGAERHCVFSTGAFVEPIQIWDEPRRLKFSVTSNPAPMEEWTPYKHIEPPHLHGFLLSEGGQFLLSQLPNGGTRLEGTTWYRHNLWPAAYWRLWSDAIIHRIHMRVLNHIREEVEARRAQR